MGRKVSAQISVYTRNYINVVVDLGEHNISAGALCELLHEQEHDDWIEDRGMYDPTDTIDIADTEEKPRFKVLKESPFLYTLEEVEDE